LHAKHTRAVFSTVHVSCTKEDKQMQQVFTFVICAALLLIISVILIIVFLKRDNIKEIQFRISLKSGIEFKSLFYKK
jgi:hypothetical protein